jgi:hypothetical protein
MPLNLCLISLTIMPRQTRSPDGNKGLYGARIIQKGVNAMWFRDKKDEGVLYPEFYKPFPEVGLALLLTAVRVGLF